MPGSGCRSTIGPDGDVPLVVRFDSTETTLAGRALTNLVTSVGSVAGSAYDVSDPAAPRRLNLVFLDASGSRDSAWTAAAREPLWVMASSYDQTGLTYAGRGIQGETLDCLYAVRVAAFPIVPPNTPSPLEMRVRPALVRSVQATGGIGLVRLAWEYSEPVGVGFQIRRTSDDRGEGQVVATVAPSVRTYDDGAVTVGAQYRYRVEAVGADGVVLHTSVQSAPASASGGRNLTVVGALDVDRPASDIWGYVAPDGREYAVLNANGLTMIDVSGAVPVEVSYVPGGESDIEVAGRYAYVSGNSDPVQVIDIADPAAPVVVREFAGYPDAPTVGVHTLSIADGYLYLNSYQGLAIWSLADPANPVYQGIYEPEFLHDVYVRGDTLYAALIAGGGIDIVDIRDKAHPVRIANVNYPGSGAHNVCMTEDGSHIFVGDEVGTGRWTRVFDVRDPQNVELVAQIVVDPDATVHNCHVRGNLLYLAHYGLGVRVWDVSDPAAPTEVAFYVSGGARPASVWTTWPYLPSGKILASDINSGLVVLRLADGVAAEAPPGQTEAGTLRVAPNPTAGAVRLSFTLARTGPARLTVHDVLGREVAVLASGQRAGGPHDVRWDARALPAGVYVVRLTTPDGTETQRLTVAR